MDNKKILIATGGTGGHVFPAYALSKYLIKNRFSVEIVTDKRGFKFLSNYKDIKIKIITSATIFKKNPFKVIFSFLQIILAFIYSTIHLLKTKPNDCISISSPRIPVKPHINTIICSTIKLDFLDRSFCIIFYKI